MTIPRVLELKKYWESTGKYGTAAKPAEDRQKNFESFIKDCGGLLKRGG